MTAILPNASETGTGVPRAVMLRRFNGELDTPMTACAIDTKSIPLRGPDGLPRPDDELVADYAAAAAETAGRPIVYLTHSSKTGLIASLQAPAGAEVIVDACQMRIHPVEVVRFLRMGWPVAITGSKFLGVRPSPAPS